MAITTTRNTRSQYFQQFTTSGTWTAPAGVDTVEVLAVAGGGGGGGGGCSMGGSGSLTATNQRPSGRGGGGGGGGEVVLRRLSVTPNTAYAVTIGAGGTGGTIGSATPSILYNAFPNGDFGAANTTGWTPTGGTFSHGGPGGTTGQTGYAIFTHSATTGSLVYDSSTGLTIPFSTVAGDNYAFSFALNNGTGATQTYVFTPNIAWYNGVTLLRTDNGSSFTFGGISSGLSYHYAFRSSNGSFGATAQASGIPATATRFILTLNFTLTSVSGQTTFDGFVLGSSRYQLDSTQGTTVTNHWLDPTTNPNHGLAWQGTANASPILTVPFGGQALTAPFGRRGAEGSNGGNTSFGSLLTTLGGGGGGGGGMAAEGMNFSTIQTLRNKLFGLGVNTGNDYQFGGAQNGGNGGGSGGYSTVSNGTGSSENYAGLGGGGGGGYTFFNSMRSGSVESMPISRGGLSSYATAGFRGYGGAPTSSGGSLPGVSSPHLSYSSSSYPILGAEGLYGFGHGGSGGGGGGIVNSNSDVLTRRGTQEAFPTNYLSTAGGLGGLNGAAGVSAGVAAAGGAGTNATIYGSGGGGGGGAGAPNATTLAGATFANGANGGAGGNGAGGYLLISWWE